MKTKIYSEDLDLMLSERDYLVESLTNKKKKLSIKKIHGEYSFKKLKHKEGVIFILEKQIALLNKYIDLLKIKKGLKELKNKNVSPELIV